MDDDAACIREGHPLKRWEMALTWCMAIISYFPICWWMWRRERLRSRPFCLFEYLEDLGTAWLRALREAWMVADRPVQATGGAVVEFDTPKTTRNKRPLKRGARRQE